jgi:predicted transcriptional regulator
MATAKEEVRRLLDALPEDASFEDVQYSIYVRERIDRGRKEAEEGKLVEQDEVENRMRRWLTE